ncbi:hypothetical protein GCM10010313_78170 [Streptomyces violarus]|uniref:Uncharacterized protein n=1 Tax=Streptomyces violarus TaxID=67380 RepID=A0A7W4ZS97_9ACTN|nr:MULTISPECIES: hypothetical protein [Streptomyces]MBB3077708.1 hypothetical protein [Streptomyces violarus]WRU00107.1 hypothetical protein VJ737_21460 [Streptomyces sp. CGMCC 4.1772]GHD33075.1 hypothetical protein GCM10010313_78170 [Streptomyces violarus]
MTELSTEPVAVEAPAPAPPPPAPAPVEKAPADAGVEHTPGGWPVVPLALSGANSTVGMVATAALAGGPIAAMVAATGAVVLGTVAATRSRQTNPRKEARRAAARTAGRSAARSAGLRRGGAGAPGSRAGGRSSAARGGRAGGRSGSGPGQHRRGSGTSARHGSTATAGKPRSKTGQGASKRAAGALGKAAGRVGQVKALRTAQQATARSRAGQRAQTTATRRAVADARRNAKARSTGGGKGALSRAGRKGGLAGRMLGGTARKARAARDAAVAKSRAKRDAKTAGTVAAKRAAVRKAPARRAARQALRRSAARFHGRRLLAALLALPVGLLGLVTSPIGRKLNLPWLVHPGRRLYRRLAGVAAEQRAERDESIRQEQAEQEAAADAEAAKDGTDGIADSVERPASTVPTSTNDPSEGEHVSGFRFEEAAAEMEQAANSYDPDNAMEILAMVEGLPAALTSVANVMKILAERSDSEFPLEKAVADGFNDIFGALMSAVAVAEDMGPLFREVHEQDIARHEDPRNGTEAEKGWNV